MNKRVSLIELYRTSALGPIAQVIGLIVMTVAIFLGLLLSSVLIYDLPIFKNPRTLAKCDWVPDKADVIYVIDTCGGFHGDGSIYIYFSCSPEDVQRIIDKQLSHSGNTGKIPENISKALQFEFDHLDIPRDKQPAFGDTVYKYELSTASAFLVDEETNQICYYFSQY